MTDLRDAFNHIVLPPQVPGSADGNREEIDQDLVRRLRDACGSVRRASTDPAFGRAWKMLDADLACTQRTIKGNLTRKTIDCVFDHITRENGLAALHIKEQNAAILAYVVDDDVVFEGFEAAPPMSSVIGAHDVLAWDFPSRAVKMPLDRFADDDFHDSFAAFLEKADTEYLAHLAFKVRKAGVDVAENRDVQKPELVTHMLFSIIQAAGGIAHVEPIPKRVRDDVNLAAGTRPWRRSPVYLVLRVATQRRLMQTLGPTVGYYAYKTVLCTLLAQLLTDCAQQQYPIGLTTLLQKKIGRKMAKLEKRLALETIRPTDRATIDSLIDSVSPILQASIQNAGHYVTSSLAQFKHTNLRKIPPLPRNANNEDVVLSLPASKAYLESLTLPLGQRFDGWASHAKYEKGYLGNPSDLPAVRTTAAFAKATTDIVLDIEQSQQFCRWTWPTVATASADTARATCVQARNTIFRLVKSVKPWAIDTVELNSLLLLEIFDNWTIIDKLACLTTPLLGEYPPVFPPPLLDLVQLADAASMARLRTIQRHLAERHRTSRYKDTTVFAPLDATCFGARYAASSASMQDLYRAVQATQSRLVEAKTREYTALCEAYETLTQKIGTTSCQCTFVDDTRDIHGCTRCYYFRLRKRLAINVSEDLLPKDERQALALIFELNVPAIIGLYRQVTWHIVTAIAYPVPPAAYGPAYHLARHDYEQNYAKQMEARGRLDVASKVKRFDHTHYKSVKMWTERKNVLLPLGARYELYDTEAMAFTSDYDRPLTVAHLVRTHIPDALRSTVLPLQPHPPTVPDTPTSYECVASRPKCPSHMSVHEYEAYQRLLGGQKIRWLTLLTELGSSNVNLGKEDAMLLVGHLALEAGPVDDNTCLGSVQHVFCDGGFVGRLLTEVERRFLGIKDNWREVNMMTTVLVLLLRVYTLADVEHRPAVVRLVGSVRKSTLAWVVALRKDMDCATDSATSKRATEYAFKAALLCRRTFELFKVDASLVVEEDDFGIYCQASIALQQSLSMDAKTLPATDRFFMQRDTILAFRLRHRLRTAAQTYTDAMARAILSSTGQTESATHLDPASPFTFSAWNFPTDEREGWAVAWLSNKQAPGLMLYHFNYVQGHLLINGKTVAKLPDDIRTSAEFRDLLGDMHVLTYPSDLAGMSYRIGVSLKDRTRIHLHLGHHDGRTVILAVNRFATFEYVPRRVFIDRQTEKYDLPRRLVDDCFHWYNQDSGLVEIRRSETRWFTRPRDWFIDIHGQHAWRGNVQLVDPFSQTFALFAQIFYGFEDTQRLTVYQPARGPLMAEFKHLELAFSVERGGRLYCRNLSAEVDPNQDAGTLYGFESMIVLRDTFDWQRRSIIAPLTALERRRNGCHVSSRARIDTRPNVGAQFAGSKAYVRFEIDSILGRLTCPPEQRLLYTKALLHAITSTPVPDPLTGKTGEEEAVHTLLSGLCQPWKPLPKASLVSLEQIKGLAPQRSYYPPDMRMQQKVVWDPTLPPGMQSDRYGRIVRLLAGHSRDLLYFEQNTVSGNATTAKRHQEIFQDTCRHHERLMTDGTDLDVRGEIQRMRYECARADSEPGCPIQPHDTPYTSIGRVHVPQSIEADDRVKGRASFVFQTAKTVMTRPPCLGLQQTLSAMLESWSTIGGFARDENANEDTVSLSTLMDGRYLCEAWGSLVELCRTADTSDAGRILFLLGALAYAHDCHTDAIRLLAAYAYMPHLRAIDPPRHAMYTDFVYMQVPSVEMLADAMQLHYREFVGKASDGVVVRGWREQNQAIQKLRSVHQQTCRADAEALAMDVLRQWPSVEVPCSSRTSEVIEVDAAITAVQGLWARLYHNKDLSNYITHAQSVINVSLVTLQREAKTTTKTTPTTTQRRAPYRIPGLTTHLASRPSPTTTHLASRPSPTTTHLASRPSPTTTHLASRPSPTTRPPDPTDMGTQETKPKKYTTPAEFNELFRVIRPFVTSTDRVRRQYGTDLAKSLVSLKALTREQHQKSRVKTVPPKETDLPGLIHAAHGQAQEAFGQLATVFAEVTRSTVLGRRPTNWLEMTGLWPRVTPVTLVELLRTNGRVVYASETVNGLVRYGLELTGVQRLYRLRRAMQKMELRRVSEELANAGHTNWDPVECPDWLVMEIDANMLIREEQVVVARAMIAPHSRKNSVFQLNMGQGKTSVILPMVLAVLADKVHLARLVVPKSLILPTAQVLQSRLGGLVGREMRHVAYSRQLLSTTNSADSKDSAALLATYRRIHETLVVRRGVLMAAPEHLLAFKLCGLQCLADGKTELGLDMVAFQTRLDRSLCRDVLDESDFTLAVRTQLVYPSGDLTLVDGAPHRWLLIQELLSLMEEHCVELQEAHPTSIKVVARPGSAYPMIHILQDTIEDTLHERLVTAIGQGAMAMFRPDADMVADLGRMSVDDGPSFSELLARALTSDEADVPVARLFGDSKAVESGLLLVRGLIKHRILVTCMKKRWNVQYGLHPDRWPIAVPYEARGVPSERSEFGHPDVAILFTCLAFYHAGLTLDQFRQGLEHVLHHVDDPATEYERWSSGDGRVEVPLDLQQWSAINLDDLGQVERLWRHLGHARTVVNHYLNKFVFPAHSRQFSVKLEASAWDLPLLTDGAVSDTSDTSDTARTTGFSGTNDNKYLLPLTIRQDDLPGFGHTNAEVSTYFLQERNRQYVCTTDGTTDGERWSEKVFVGRLSAAKIQVLVDAGAYILELGNEALARMWLQVDRLAPAAVYFEEKTNRAMVVFRETTAQNVPLVSSPYADNLAECLVYFDEAHTRGVDIQLPPHARGALTLALGQTRDHTAQAALRLRQLATSQAVTFFAPPEVDQSIRDVCRAHDAHGAEPSVISSPHVVAWLLEQTCKANDQLSSLHAAHGHNFCTRTDALWTHRQTLDDAKSRSALLRVLEQPERQTFQTMYGGGNAARSDSSPLTNHTILREYMSTLRLRSFDTGTAGAFEEVEQEREVEVQVEEEDITDRRVSYTALSFPGVSASLRAFVETGTMAEDPEIQQVFASMAKTTLGTRFAVHETHSRLYVSTEYQRTVRVSRKQRTAGDHFLRPTEWLLWSPTTDTGVVVVPEELEALLPVVRSRQAVHVVAYAAAVTRSMLDFGSLQFLVYPALPSLYRFPSWLRVEIGVLAGRLYMRFAEAMEMKQYLEKTGHLMAHWRAVDADKKKTTKQPGFCSDPTSFLLEWLPVRRAAQDIMHTPAAYICQGRRLRHDHAFFYDPSIAVAQARARADDATDSGDHGSSSSSIASVEGQESSAYSSDEASPEC